MPHSTRLPRRKLATATAHDPRVQTARATTPSALTSLTSRSAAAACYVTGVGGARTAARMRRAPALIRACAPPWQSGQPHTLT